MTTKTTMDEPGDFEGAPVSTLAKIILDWMLDYGIDREFSYRDIEEDLGVAQQNARSAMPKVATLAAGRGLCVTTPVHGNGYTMVLTANDAEAAVDSLLHVGSVRRGVEYRETLLADHTIAHAKPGSDAAFLSLQYEAAKERRRQEGREQARAAQWLMDKRREEQRAAAESDNS